MKKLWKTLSMPLAALCLLAACGPAPQSGALPPPVTPASTSATNAAVPPVVRLGVVLPFAGHAFIADSERHALAQLEALRGRAEVDYDYLLVCARDEADEADAVAEVLAWGANTVLLWPTGGLRAPALAVQAAGARLVLYGGALDGVTPDAAICGDNAAIGQWTGQYMVRHLAQPAAPAATGGPNETDEPDETGEAALPEEQAAPIGYLRFVGDGSAAAAARSAGMDEAIASMGYAGDFEQLAPDFATGWSGAEAAALLTAWLDKADEETLAALRVIVTQDDELVDGIVGALEAWQAGHPGLVRLELITGVGGRRETLALFDRPAEDAPPEDAPPENNQAENAPAALPAAGAELVTYHYSPGFIRQAVLLADAAARGAQYAGQDIAGQTFLIPTIEIDRATVNAYRAGREYAERYA